MQTKCVIATGTTLFLEISCEDLNNATAAERGFHIELIDVPSGLNCTDYKQATYGLQPSGPSERKRFVSSSRERAIHERPEHGALAAS